MNRPWEWQAAGTQLHAIPALPTDPFPPMVGDRFPTLCGATVELDREDFRRRQSRKMCHDCHTRYVEYLRTGRIPVSACPSKPQPPAPSDAPSTAPTGHHRRTS